MCQVGSKAKGVISMPNIIWLNDEEFLLISKLIYNHFGINLTEKKKNLIVGRLQKEMFARGFKNYKEYYNYIIQDPTGEELLNLVDRISTNHSFFFREQSHYEFLISRALPEIMQNHREGDKGEVRIWSAGCASGEEPYTLAMVLDQYLSSNDNDHLKTDLGILATDISTSSLEKAVEGIYPEERLEQIPAWYREKYFNRLTDGFWEIKPSVKANVLFRRLNLMRPNYPFKKKFHIIFCRNVMIYFDRPTQQALVERFYRYTEPGGYLIIGHSESINWLPGFYQYMMPTVYKKIDS